jgi:hypothetical protein
MSTRVNRRAILAVAAAAAVPVPALALPDPAFAAIAARKATLAACNAYHSEDDAPRDRLSAADCEAIRAMLRTPPTTPAGMKALLRYVTECEEAGDDILQTHMDEKDTEATAFARTMGGEVFLRTLLTALEGLSQ